METLLEAKKWNTQRRTKKINHLPRGMRCSLELVCKLINCKFTHH